DPITYVVAGEKLVVDHLIPGLVKLGPMREPYSVEIEIGPLSATRLGMNDKVLDECETVKPEKPRGNLLRVVHEGPLGCLAPLHDVEAKQMHQRDGAPPKHYAHVE